MHFRHVPDSGRADATLLTFISVRRLRPRKEKKKADEMRFAFVTVLLLAVAVAGQRRICRPYSVFKVSCNTCRCTPDGTDMACTRRKCPQDLSEGNKKICEPGLMFRMNCNNCICNDDGTNAACTLKACPRE